MFDVSDMLLIFLLEQLDFLLLRSNNKVIAVLLVEFGIVEVRPTRSL